LCNAGLFWRPEDSVTNSHNDIGVYRIGADAFIRTADVCLRLIKVSALDPETRVTLKLAGVSIFATCVGITLFYSGISPTGIAAEIRTLAQGIFEALNWSLSHGWH